MSKNWLTDRLILGFNALVLSFGEFVVVAAVADVVFAAVVLLSSFSFPLYASATLDFSTR